MSMVKPSDDMYDVLSPDFICAYITYDPSSPTVKAPPYSVNEPFARASSESCSPLMM